MTALRSECIESVYVISDDVIEGARAVLEDVVFLLDGVPCPLTTEHSLPIEHALNVMVSM